MENPKCLDDISYMIKVVGIIDEPDVYIDDYILDHTGELTNVADRLFAASMVFMEGLIYMNQGDDSALQNIKNKIKRNNSLFYYKHTVIPLLKQAAQIYFFGKDKK